MNPYSDTELPNDVLSNTIIIIANNALKKQRLPI
jgi:hypothetical protein